MMAYKSAKGGRVSPINPSCNKKIYNSLEEAEDMIRYITENRITRELRAYQCSVCGMWHLTSSPE
jgi:hypothetical protein